jgi:PPP family 3-phenylpropionic acid transporter
LTTVLPPAAPSAGALPAFAGLSFAYFAYAGLFSTYSPLWFEHLGYSTLAIGTLVSLQSATRLFTPYVWAWLADHSGQRVRLLRWAVAASLVASAGYLVAPSYGWVAAVTVALFLCTAGVIPLSEAALAHWVSGEGVLDAGRYGRVRLWGSIGFILAVSAAGFGLEASGVERFPWFVVVVLAGLGLASLQLPLQHEAAHAEAPAPGVLHLLRRPEIAWFFASVFFTVLAHQALYAFFSLYLADLGYGKGAIGMIWALGVVVEVIWFWLQGRWFARLSAHRWLVIAGMTTALRLAAVAGFGAIPGVLVLGQLTHAITFAAQHTACIDVVNRHFGGRARGRGQALYAVIGYGFSGVVAGVAGGALVEAAGFSAVFWAASLAGLIAAVCAWNAMRAERRRH